MSIPTKPAGATRVQVVSDLHLDPNHADAVTRTAAILARLQNGLDDLAPDKVHMIGDNITDDLDYSSDLVTAVGNCTAAGADVYALMGNHDYEYALGNAASQAAFLAAMAGTPTTALNHHYEIGDFCFVFFSITDYLPWATDATLPPDEVAIGQRTAGHAEADFLWLEATLAAYSASHRVILHTHMPPQRFDYLGRYIDMARSSGFPNWCLYKQASRDRLRTIARTYNIALWIFGHEHATHHLDEFAADFPADPLVGQYVNYFRGTAVYGGEAAWGSGWFCSDSSVQYSGIVPINGESIFFDVGADSNTLTVYSYDHTLRDAFKTTVLPLLAKASVIGTPGAVPGTVLELHAAKALSGTDHQINSPLGTQWFEVSGNDHHGTLTGFSGTPWVGTGTPSDPYRLVFDPAAPGDYVQTAGFAQTSNQFTVDAWIYQGAGVGNENKTLLAHGLIYTDGWHLLASENVPYFMLSRAGAAEAVGLPVGARPLSTAQGHFAFVFDIAAKTMRPYRSGVAVGGPISYANAMVLPGATRKFELAARAAVSFWLGGLASVRYYPFALTAAQVAQNYNAGPLWTPAMNLPIIGSPIVKGIGGTP